MIRRGGPGGEALRLEAESKAALARAATTADPAAAKVELESALAKAGDAELAAAYTYLQRVVGIIAVALPAAVVVGHGVLGEGDEWVRGSISSYYYTHMGNVFVGALCALAVFFLSYHYRPLPSFRLDSRLSKLACAAAVGVAVFPTSGRGASDEVPALERLVSGLHLGSAGLLFVLLGVLAYFRFTLTGPAGPMTPEKQKRNRLYRACGTIIFVAIALIIVSLRVNEPKEWHAFFWLETVCVEAFGVSWLVKGGFLGILADKQPQPVSP